MENTEVVKEEAVTEEPVREDEKTQEQEPSVVEGTDEKPATQSGDKTDPNLLLKSLQDERERRREAEERARLAEERLTSSALPDPDVVSDEGRVLSDRIKKLEDDLAATRSESAKAQLIASNPILKERWADFEDFRNDPENRGMNLRTAAKAFLVENGLLDVPRKGLEKASGGPRVPVSSEMTADDVKQLRETDFRKYAEMVKKGLIKIA